MEYSESFDLLRRGFQINKSSKFSLVWLPVGISAKKSTVQYNNDYIFSSEGCTKEKHNVLFFLVLLLKQCGQQAEQTNDSGERTTAGICTRCAQDFA